MKQLPNLRRQLQALAIGAGLALAGFAAAGVPIDARIDDRLAVTVRSDSTLDGLLAELAAIHPQLTFIELDRVTGRTAYLLGVEGLTPIIADQIEVEFETGVYASALSGELLYTNRTAEGHTGSTWVSGLASAAYQDQYATSTLGLPAAHGRATGAGTVVAVVDTGIDPLHPLLAARLAPGGYDFVDDDGDPTDAGNGVDDDGDGDVDEMLGHGTFVGGLVALVAPDARLLPVRVLDADGGGNQWLAARGLYHAIDQGVEVINLSLGSTYDSALIKQALAEAMCKGIVVVASAGNFAQSSVRERPAMDDIGCDPTDPEDECDPIDADCLGPMFDFTGALGVAATDSSDRKADFSNYHRKITLSAPGDIDGDPTDPTSSIISSRPGGEYAAWKGTSFSTAFVSGAAALVRSQHPQWSSSIETALTIEQTLKVTATDIYGLNPEFAKDEELGAGRLDVASAVAIGPVAPALGDLDGDGVIGFIDLLSLLSAWGETHTAADLNGDGTVSFVDLLTLLAGWS